MMWSLIIITIVSMDPPSYYYNPVARMDTLSQCELMADSIRKNETGKPTRIMCVRNST
jgi:hypothetical protein